MNISQEEIEKYVLGHKLENMTKKELIEYIVKQAQIITSQEKENERYRIAINEMAFNISKATEYIEKSIKGDNISNCSKDLIWININTEKIENLDKILEILKGSDRVQEIVVSDEFKDFLNKENEPLKELAKEYDTYINNAKDKEIERLNKTLEYIDTYIHLWKLEEIGEKTMLILNDILLIKNGMSDEVVRLKDSDKE